MESNAEQRTLTDDISEQLTRKIVSGELAQGSKIIEEDLAKLFGVSRGSLREAIRRLEGNRLLTRKPHAGVRVVQLDHHKMSELYLVREALEGMSARQAAAKMSIKEIDSLWKLLDDHGSDIEDANGKVYVQGEGNLDFHFRIASASNNQWISHLLSNELYQLLRMCRQCSGQLPSRPAPALSEHQNILEAISHRDGELAEILMRRHISGAWRLLNTIIPEEN